MTRTILEKRPYSTHNGDWYLEYVLAQTDNRHTPYVMWLYHKIDDAYYDGHYFTNLIEAKEDFIYR